MKNRYQITESEIEVAIRNILKIVEQYSSFAVDPAGFKNESIVKYTFDRGPVLEGTIEFQKKSAKVISNLKCVGLPHFEDSVILAERVYSASGFEKTCEKICGMIKDVLSRYCARKEKLAGSPKQATSAPAENLAAG